MPQTRLTKDTPADIARRLAALESEFRLWKPLMERLRKDLEGLETRRFFSRLPPNPEADDDIPF